MSRRRAGVALVLAALLGVAAIAPTLAAAGTGGLSPDAAARLRLMEQTPWVAPDGEFRARLGLDQPAPGATLSVALHSRLADRDEFGASLEGDPGPLFNPGPTVTIGESAPPDDVRPGWQVTVNPDSTVDVAVAVRDGSPGEEPRALLPEAGVYPLVVTLESTDGERLDEMVLFLVRVPAPDTDARALDAALVVPVHAPLALRPDGTLDLPPQRLDQLADLLGPLNDHPDVPLTVVPTPETVDALARADDPRAGQVLESLRAALPGRQVLATPFVPIDLSSWVASGLDESLSGILTRGADRLATALEVRPDRRTWIADPTITPEALTALRGLGVDQVVLPEPILGPLEPEVFEHTLTQGFEVVNSEGDPQRAMMADLGLAGRINATSDPVLDANRVLADLAVLHFADPERAQSATVVLPSDDQVDPAFLDMLLTAFETPTVVTPVTLNTLFARTSDATVDGPDDDGGPTLVRGFAPQPSPPLGTYPDVLRATQRQVAGYRSLLGHDQPLAYPLEELESVSGASGLSEQERLAYLDALSARIDQAVAAIHVEQQAVTLTDRSGVLPVSVRNDLLEPISVRVHVDSDRLEFPDSPTLTAEVPPGVSTLEIPVEARASGAFPVDVRVSSPDDVITLSEARVTVRSTAVSGLGIVLAVLAALFLLLWWARHFRSVRRAHRLVSTRHPAAQQRARQAQDQYLERIGGSPSGGDPGA